MYIIRKLKNKQKMMMITQKLITTFALSVIVGCAYAHKENTPNINETWSLLRENTLKWSNNQQLFDHLHNLHKISRTYKETNDRPLCGFGNQGLYSGKSSNTKDHPRFMFNILNNIERMSQQVPWYSFLSKYRLYSTRQTYMDLLRDIKNYKVTCGDHVIENYEDKKTAEKLKLEYKYDPNFKLFSIKSIIHENGRSTGYASMQETDFTRYEYFNKLLTDVNAQSSLHKTMCLIKTTSYAGATALLWKYKATLMQRVTKWIYYPVIGCSAGKALYEGMGFLTTRVNQNINVVPDSKV